VERWLLLHCLFKGRSWGRQNGEGGVRARANEARDAIVAALGDISKKASLVLGIPCAWSMVTSPWRSATPPAGWGARR